MVLKFTAFEMLYPYTLFNIELPNIIVVGAFTFVFLFNIVFSMSLLESELLLLIGSYSFRSCLFSLMLSCKISKRFGEEKSLSVFTFSILIIFEESEAGMCGCH